MLFSNNEEKSFIEHLNVVAEWGYPFDTVDLRLLAKAYLDKRGRTEYRLKNNLPGPDWAKFFFIRHKNKISNRFSANITTKRAGLTHKDVDTFFQNASNTLEIVNPDFLINYDETNLTDNPAQKSLYLKGV